MVELEEGAVCGPDGCEVPAKTADAAALPHTRDLLVVSDVVCPWCYVGKRRLEKALAMLGGKARFRVRWLPFELNPQMPAGGVPRDVYRVQKFGSLERSRAMDAQLAQAAAGEGIQMRHDLMKVTPNTFAAHRLIFLAGQKSAEAQDAVVEALFRAYFCEGRDVGDANVLAEAGAEAGMEKDAVLAWLAGTEGADEVRGEEQAAMRAGISGVPAFVAGNRLLFSGAQPPEMMAAALKQIASLAL